LNSITQPRHKIKPFSPKIFIGYIGIINATKVNGPASHVLPVRGGVMEGKYKYLALEDSGVITHSGRSGRVTAEPI
jgi:hypothetical protein